MEQSTKKRKVSSESPYSSGFKSQKIEDVRSGDQCPFMDTINRRNLDFDFEKVCSVSLSPHNVYACLVCGSFFAGRSKGTHAYFHSLHQKHHIFIHLHNGKIYCLPDDYRIQDPSLSDIVRNLHPTFQPVELALLDKKAEYVNALDGTSYLPGRIGLNNLGHADWLNSVLQCLVNIRPLRNFFLVESNYATCTSRLVIAFGEFTRKFFSPHNFKGQISPHEIIQAVIETSDRKFVIGRCSDPIEFLVWFLNALHRDLGGGKKRNSSVITKIFQGQVKITTVRENAVQKDNSGKSEDAADPPSSVKRSPFMYLSLALPDTPLFRGGDTEQFIPQVPMIKLLSKFDGKTEELSQADLRIKYSITRLPPFLIVHMKRFTQNVFNKEKNPTIVNFPIKNLDLAEYFSLPELYSETALHKMMVRELKKIATKHDISIGGCLEKAELIKRILAAQPSMENIRTRYDLVGNVVHEGKNQDKGTIKAYVLHKPNNQWYEAQDLHVVETMPQLVAVSESYIQFWELKQN
eukprot:289721_1